MTTRTTLSLALAIASVLSFAGCQKKPADVETPPGERADTAAPATQTPSTDATGAGTVASDTRTAADTANTAAGMVPAGESLAYINAVDEHEIAAAEQAKQKKVAGSVLDYADLLHREHSENLKAGQALSTGTGAIQPDRTAEVNAMREKGQADLATLGQKSGKDYEKAYVDAMVKGHTEALSLIDDRLLPAAQDEKLRNYLTNTRDHVAMHLQRGKDLQAAGR